MTDSLKSVWGTLNEQQQRSGTAAAAYPPFFLPSILQRQRLHVSDVSLQITLHQ
jgi:hypothetical protein